MAKLMNTPTYMDQALATMGVSGRMADMAQSIYKQESGGGKNTKTSNAGAIGGMQMLKGTFDSVADKGWDINDPLHNAMAGVRYLQQLDKHSGGDSALTAAGYYGGLGGMLKAKKGIAVSDPRNPNAPNTLQYGQQVVARMGGKSAPVNPPPVSVLAQADNVPMAIPQTTPMVAAAPTPTPVPYTEVPEQMEQQVAAAPQQEMESPWEAFKFDIPRQVIPTDLNYGGQPSIQPNFSRGFGGFGRFGTVKGRV